MSTKLTLAQKIIHLIEMLSYLETVKKLVESEIYNRGVKLYLEGNVLGFEDLILDYWRRYEVRGRSETYIVDIPLLHLALDKRKFTQADQALRQIVRSDSPYFQEFGVCPQVVAVCAALDQEFKIQSQPATTTKPAAAAGVWDKILEAESGKKEREWLAALETFIYSDFREQSRHFRQLKEMLAEVVDNPKASFPEGLTNIFQAVVGDYLLEKNLVRLFAHPFFLSKGGLIWWGLVWPFFVQMDKDNQVKLAGDLWKNYLAGNAENLESELTGYLSTLTQEVKDQALFALQKEFKPEPENWIRFAIQSENLLWAEQNLDQLDGRFLVAVARQFPDKREEIEQRLVREIQIWSDFLPPGEYDELLGLLELWKKDLGRSDYFEEVLKYIRQNHRKKSKLIGGLEKIG